MNFVLDASVTLAWAFEDEGGEYARDVLARLEREEACTTALWPLEISMVFCNPTLVRCRS